MADKKIILSVVLATRNEESNISRCLKAVNSWVDDIVVVDGNSSDKTRQIAKKLGARVYKTTNKPMFHINKQLALDKASNEWVLQLDADEVVTKKLRQEIDEVLESRTLNLELGINGYFIPRKNYFLGKWLKKGGQYPDYVIRLVKKRKASFPCKSVHEQIKIKGKVGHLKSPLDHHAVPTVSRYWTNANRYTSLTANEFKRNNIKINVFSAFNYLVFKPLKTFFIIYFRHKGFLDGMPGFLFALFSALHHPIAYLKYWELRKNLEHRI